MQWTHYFHNIVGHYLVIIEGWPERIPFTNLSTASSVLPDLELLLRLWESGGIFWKKLSEAEYEALCHEHDAKLNSGELVEHTRKTRSDKGAKRTRQKTVAQKSNHTFKSSEIVPSDTEDEGTHTPASEDINIEQTNPAETELNNHASQVAHSETGPNNHASQAARSETEPNNHASQVAHSAINQGCTFNPNPPPTLHIPEIDLDLALCNLNQDYSAMWAQHGDGEDGYGIYGLDLGAMSFGN